MTHRISAACWTTGRTAGAVVLALACACAPTGPPSPPDLGGKTLVIGTSQEPDSLSSLIGNLAISADVMSLMWRRLVEIGPDGRGRCALCVELPTLDNGLWRIDRQRHTSEATFRLRRGMRWADGVEITARDAVFAWELKTDPQYEYGATDLRPIAGIDALDAHALRVRYASIWPFADSDVRVVFLPEHYYRPIWTRYKDQGGTYWQRFLADERVGVKPLVNGPFGVSEWVSGSHILLARNPAYNISEPPKVERVLIRFIPDLNTLAVNVRTRQVHLTDGWLTLEQARGLESAGGLEVRYLNPMWLEHATLQINQPPLDDRRVRRALLHAIDRDGINAALFQGKQPPADSWLAAYHPAYNPGVRKYAYDPAEAARLLSEAGWRRDGGGALRNDAGARLSLTLVTIAGDKLRSQVAEVIQAQWAELGIDVRIAPQSARLLFSETLPRCRLPPGGIAVWRWVLEPQEARYANSLWRPRDEHSLDHLLTDSPWGRIRRNVELIDRALEAVDPEERYALLREQQRIWADELPVLPLYWHVRVATVDARLRGYDPHPFAAIGWNVERWDLAPDSRTGF
jgi:peptide/nickel transport system substrate-binding protein